ncbi:expressed unknown protein [Seminavis robusta]|uniref:NAD(P)-binding domain-containing protein n=1 Tax=Seminavis robusta TaxID=568900 RepID=A0A9N8DA64_9STRA|nr:expressed unknown protein [Seminavis robusta]|eukprot:Sro48_g028440.1 n/a (190) ;mRNA; r:146431-147000
MAGAPAGKPKDYPKDLMLNFVTTLTEVIREQQSQSSSTSVKVVLYQADAFSPTPDRPLTIVNSVVKTVLGKWIMGIGPNCEDNTNVVQYYYDNANALGFKFIVSRPAALNDKQGDTEELKADHFSSTNFPITLADLAVWTLKALQDSSLYGTFPFVVPVDQDILPHKNKPDITSPTIMETSKVEDKQVT